MLTKHWFYFIFATSHRTRVRIKYTIYSTHARTHTQTTVEVFNVPSYSRHPNFAFLALDTLLCLRT